MEENKIHICKECGFEIERNGHALICSQYVRPDYSLLFDKLKKSKRVSK